MGSFIETRIIISSLTVISPRSNALSCSIESNNPFLGFNLFDSSTRQGTIWLATNNFGMVSPDIQHLLLYALSTALRKNDCPTGTSVCTVLLVPRKSDVSGSSSCGILLPLKNISLSVIRCISFSDSSIKSPQLFYISSHMLLSANDAPSNPLRPDEVMTGSRLAMFDSFMARADGVRSISSAYLMISGFREFNFPKGIWQ